VPAEQDNSLVKIITNEIKAHQSGVVLDYSGQSIRTADAIYVTESGNVIYIDVKRNELVAAGRYMVRRPISHSKNETVKEEPPQAFNDRLEKLILAAREGLYDLDSTDNFAKQVQLLIKEFGDSAVIALAPYVLKPTSSEIGAEILRSLANIGDQETYSSRRWVILTALQSQSAWIRDAATLAVAALEDPMARPYLETAIAKEKNEDLRRNMIPVLEYLQSLR
jgi:hypothetical protein